MRCGNVNSELLLAVPQPGLCSRGWFERLTCLLEKALSCPLENCSMMEAGRGEGANVFPALGPSQDTLHYRTGLVEGVMCIHPRPCRCQGIAVLTCGPGAMETRLQSAQLPVRPDGAGSRARWKHRGNPVLWLPGRPPCQGTVWHAGP